MYSPAIDEEQVVAMYHIRTKTGKSIAQQAREAIASYLKRKEKEVVESCSKKERQDK